MTRESAKLVAKLWLRRKSAMKTDDIPEGMNKRMILQIRKLTDMNDHTKAVLELAKRVGEAKYVAIAEAIQVIQDFDRHMSSDLISTRNKVMNYCLKKARSKFRMSPEEYEALRMSF